MSEDLADLARQARRLRFVDPAWEQRFQEERQAEGLTRARVMMALGMMLVGALGVVDAALNARALPDFARGSLQLRFLVVAPVWLAMLVSTALPRHGRRADGVYAVGTTLIAWALAVLPLSLLHARPGAQIAQQLDINVLAVLMISTVALPMRFGAAVATVLCSVGGVMGLFFAARSLTGPDQLRVIIATLGGIGLLIVALSWYREVGERRMFGQREQMRKLNAELARLNTEKNEFMAIAAHDLRAPLASVRGLAAQLRAGRLVDPDKNARAHFAIHDLAGRMLDLVNNYLGAHAAESGTLPVQLTRLDLQEAMEQAAARHGAAAGDKGQTIRIAAGAPVWVRGDAGLLAQVTDNFMSNALKFSPRAATMRVEVARAENGSAARLRVTDEGPGIAAGEQANLFRKFSRLAARPTGGEASHGLGLAVAKRLAETMGGKVGCDSPPGGGATFWIELPAEA